MLGGVGDMTENLEKRETTPEFRDAEAARLRERVGLKPPIMPSIQANLDRGILDDPTEEEKRGIESADRYLKVINE